MRRAVSSWALFVAGVVGLVAIMTVADPFEPLFQVDHPRPDRKVKKHDRKMERTAAGPACTPTSDPVALPEIPEASGIAASRTRAGLLWIENDSGEPVVYGVDASGKVLERVHVTGAELVDWESLTIGPCAAGSCLYVADIGDNDAVREEITIYRVAEPPPGATGTEPASAFRARYPDGAQNAESIFVDEDERIYVLTKGDTGPVTLYRFTEPSADGTSTLERVRALSEGPVDKRERVTDADADGARVVVRTRRSVAFHDIDGLVSGREPELVFALPDLEGKGEGVALAGPGELYLAGEGRGEQGAGTLVRVVCAM